MTEVVTKHENSPEVETKYKPGIEGFFKRVKKFVRITEKVQEAVEKVPQEQVTKEQAEKVSGLGFFERIGAAIDRGIDKVKSGAEKAWEGVKDRFEKGKEYFKAKSEEISDRRKELGIVDTVKSYVQDGVDSARSGIKLVEAKWKDAEVSQLVDARAGLRKSYEEAKQMRAEGKVVPEGYILNRAQLRAALKPIRTAELAARAERRALRAEAKKLRRRIEKKQNARELLQQVRNGNASLAPAAAI